jgi:hypothetical protein
MRLTGPTNGGIFLCGIRSGRLWLRPLPPLGWQRRSRRSRHLPRPNFMAAADFTAVPSMAAVVFVAAAGEAAVGAGPDGAAAGVTVAQAGAGAVVGAAAVGIAAGAGTAAGAGVGIRAGRSRRRPCPSGSRSLRSRPMAAILVAGSGGASGQPAATILAGGLSTFATDRLRAVSSDDSGPVRFRKL